MKNMNIMMNKKSTRQKRRMQDQLSSADLPSTIFLKIKTVSCDNMLGDKGNFFCYLN